MIETFELDTLGHNAPLSPAMLIDAVFAERGMQMKSKILAHRGAHINADLSSNLPSHNEVSRRQA